MARHAVRARKSTMRWGGEVVAGSASPAARGAMRARTRVPLQHSASSSCVSNPIGPRTASGAPLAQGNPERVGELRDGGGVERNYARGARSNCVDHYHTRGVAQRSAGQGEKPARRIGPRKLEYRVTINLNWSIGVTLYTPLSVDLNVVLRVISHSCHLLGTRAL